MCPAGEDEYGKWQIDQAYKDLVTCLLSNTRINPIYKGKEFEFFKPYEDDVTPEQIAAFKGGPFNLIFQHFYDAWNNLPESDRPDLYRITDMMASISGATLSMYRYVENAERSNGRELTDLEILRQTPFLVHDSFTEKTFDTSHLAEALTKYLDIGIRSPFLETSVLRISVTRAYYVIATDATGLTAVRETKR